MQRLLTLLFVSCLAWALPPAPRLQPADFDVPVLGFEQCWPSGLFVQVGPRPGSGFASVTLLVGGRSLEEAPTRGAAHLVEHLYFKSHPRGGEADVRALEAGIDATGQTTADATAYVFTGTAADLPRLLTLAGSALEDPLRGVTADDIGTEQGIVESELMWRGAHSQRLARSVLDQAMFPGGHPYAGDTTSLVQAKALTPADLEAFVAAAYRPGAAALRVEGDIDADAFPQQLQAAFADHLLFADTQNACAHRTETRPPPGPGSTATRVVEAPVWHRQLWFGFSLPAGYTPDDVLYDAATRALQFHLEEQMPFVQGQKGADTFYGVDCGFEPGRVASRVTCVLQLADRAQAAEALKAVNRALPAKWDPATWSLRIDQASPSIHLLTGHAVAGAVARALGDADAIDVDTRVERALYGWITGKPSHTIERMAGAEKLDHDTILDVARKWLTAERMVSVVLEPAALDAGDERPAVGPVQLDAPTWSGSTPRPVLPSLATRTYDNGLTALVVARPDTPLTHAGLVFPGGSAGEGWPGANEALAVTARWDAPVWLGEMRSRLAARQGLEWGPRANLAWASMLAGNRDAALYVLRVLVDGLEHDFAARQAQLDRSVAVDFEGLRERPTYTSEQIRLDHLVGDHPAGAAFWETVAHARKVREDDALAWGRTTLHPRNGTLIVVGSGDDLETWRHAAKYLARWKGKATKRQPPTPVPLPPPPPRKVLVHPFDGVLTEVHATCRVPGRTADSDAALDVLQAVLDRGMWQTVREGGATYAVGAQIEDRGPQLGLLTLTAAVRPGQGEATAAAMLGLLETVAGGAPDEVVAWEKADVLGAHARAFGSPGAMFDRLAWWAGQPGGLDGMSSYPDRVEGVDAAALSGLLTDCVQHEVVSVIGDETLAQLAHEEVDWRAVGEGLVKANR